MPQQANLIHETSDTTGTGNFTLTAVAQRFSAAFGTGAGNTFDYFIVNREAVEWERGIGYMSDANTLVRDTVIESSNSNAAVNFSAGTKDVANDVPAAEQLRSTSNLSDIDDASTARGNLGLAIGTNVQAHDADLDALAALSGTGLLARTAANTYAERTIQGGDGIDLTNGNGVSGNPSLAVDSTVARLNAENQALTGGAVVTSKSLGTQSSGTLTLDMGDRPLQHYTNGGAHTLAPGTNAGSILLDITNNASAGAITTSGFTFVSGDSFTTTNGHKFRCHVSVGNAGSLLDVRAMQ